MVHLDEASEEGFFALWGVDLEAITLFHHAHLVDEIGAAGKEIEQFVIDGIDLVADVVEIHGMGRVLGILLRCVTCGCGRDPDGAEGELLVGIGSGRWFLGGFWQFHLAEFRGIWEVVDGPDAKVFEEEVGGFVQEGATG